MTELAHDDNLVVAVPFWTMREAPSLLAAVVYQQMRFWMDDGPSGEPRAAKNGWVHHRDQVPWLAIPDHAWAEIGLSADQLYRVRKLLADHGWIESRRMKVDGRPLACVRVLPRKSAESDSAEPRDSQSATSRDSHSADERNPPLLETVDTGETSRAAARAQFEDYFWPAYPARDGRKIGKAKALEQWRRLTIEDRRGALRAARIMAAADARPPDAFRWLRDRTWEDWLVPPDPTAIPARRRGQQTLGEKTDIIIRGTQLAADAGLIDDDEPRQESLRELA